MSHRRDRLTMSLEQLAHVLGGEVRGNNQVLCPGPDHSPEDRSLSVKVNADGTWTVYSYADDNPIECKDHIRKLAGLPAWKSKPNGPLEGGLGPRPPSRDRKIVARYDYVDESGNLLFQVVRADPKKFAQRRPNGSDWIWNLNDTRRVLYRLPELIEAVAQERPIFICEGEKAVDAAVKLGVPATCSPHGAGKWRDEYSPHLEGASVVILPDNDEPGRKHAEQVAKSLRGVAASVKVLILPGLPDGGDVYDWIQAGGTAEKLWALVDAETVEGKPEADKPEDWRVHTFTAAVLRTMPFPEVSYVVPGIIPEGLTILAGRPKIGKSWMALDLAIGVAIGQNVLGGVKVAQGDVLYCCLEDNPRRLQRRISVLNPQSEIAHSRPKPLPHLIEAQP
jgi:AAA domain-containing protein